MGQFGEEAWGFISRADARLRSEHLDHIRRDLRTAAQNYGYQEVNPWSACFAASVRDADFWQRELTIPATLFLARNKREPRDTSGPSNQPDGGRKKAQEPTGGMWVKISRGREKMETSPTIAKASKYAAYMAKASAGR